MAKSLMIVGTMSSAGKSLITAGLCRIFSQDGHRTAPFKSQNMALNSYITRDGFEMGRAQVMQAEAAGIEPSVEMNPILLKPTSEMGSQVIVNGEVLKTMSAADYYKMKKTLVPDIMRAYNSLAEKFDIIVLEGAGSPAEINLKKDDIVNMGMAEMADAPVLLVADIDRGGVFASIYGTVMLMEEHERARIKGIIINKFRGDVEILRPGLDMIEQLTGIPVIGVVPYMSIDVDDEDSLSERLGRTGSGECVDIAVIRLPRISNFTDFNVFGLVDGASVRYADSVRKLGEPDLIIIPGTKSTMSDLQWMRENGLEAAILKRHERGCPIIGICGGFQMLGKTLSDPLCTEGGGEMRGIGLLDIATTFKQSKTRTRTGGVIADIGGVFGGLSGMKVSGYEIHMGESENAGGAEVFSVLDGGRTDGFASADSSVIGTYLHGIFDSEGAASEIVAALMRKKGIEPSGEVFDVEKYKQGQYDILADTLRKSLDIDKIYDIIFSEV